MSTVLLKKGDQELRVLEEDAPDLIKEGWAAAEAIALETEAGRQLFEPEEISGQLDQGATAADSGVLRDRAKEQFLDRKFSDTSEGVQAFGEAGLSTLTMGLSDKLTEGINEALEGDAGLQALRAEERSGASLGGSIVAGIGGAALGIGVPGLAVKAGKAAAGAVKGGKAVKGAIAGVTEGTIFGGSQAVANTLLHDKELTAESVVGGMGTGALFGGILGAAGGALAGRAANKASKASKQAANELGETAFKQLDDLKRAREALKLEAKGLPDAITRKAWNAELQVVSKAEREVTKVLGSKPSEFATKVARLEPVQLKKFVTDLKRYDEATNLLANATGRELPPVQLFASADDFATKAGLNSGKASDIAAIAKTAGIKDADTFAAEVAGSPLAENAVKTWAASKKLGLGNAKSGGDFFKAGFKAAKGTLNWTNPAVAMGAVLGRATGAISTAKATVGNGLVKAISNTKGLRVGYTPGSATVMNRVSFDAGLDVKPANTGKSQATYQARVAELLAAQANPAAFQQKIRERVAPLAHMSPEAGEAIVAQTAKVAEYLAGKISRPATMFSFGSDDGLPVSQTTIDNLAAYMQGATDPLSIIDDIENEALDPRAAEAMRELYPTMFAEAQVRIATMTPDEKKKVPWSKQVQLSIFFGVPMHEILRPEAIAAIQDGYAQRAQEMEQPAKDFSTPGKVGNGVGITEPPTGAQKLEMK